MPRKTDDAALPWAITFAVVVLFVEKFLGGDKNPWVWYISRGIFIPYLFFATWYFMSRTPVPKWIFKTWQKYRFASQTEEDYSALVNQWANYVRRGPSSETSRIRAAVAKEYVSQEKDDLGKHGDLNHRLWTEEIVQKIPNAQRPEGRPLVITSFIRYSKMVEAMVNAAKESRDRKNQRVLCIAALSMPLEKWFNFDERSHCIHNEWEKYLKFLRGEVQAHNDVILARILLVHKGKPEQHVTLQSKESLANEIKSWVWLKDDADDPSAIARREPELTFIGYKERLRILDFIKDKPGVDSSVIKEIRRRTSAKKESYLIIPPSGFTKTPPQVDGGQFAHVGEQFIKTFQTEKTDGYHAYYSPVDPGLYLPDWKVHIKLPPLPLDLFFVGLVSEEVDRDNLASLLGNVKPLFCLGAEPPDKGIYMAYLYLLDPHECKLNFPEIEKYIKVTLKPEPLSSLLP